MRPLIAIAVLIIFAASFPASAQIVRSLPSNSRLWQSNGQPVRPDGCSEARCERRRIVLVNGEGGICRDAVLANRLLWIAGRSTYGVELNLLLHDASAPDGPTFRIHAIVSFAAGGVQTLCLPATLSDGGINFDLQIAPSAPPVGNIDDIHGPEVTAAPATADTGILLTGGSRSNGVAGYFALSGRGVIDFLFGRSSNSLVRVKITSRRAGRRLFWGKQLIGNTDLKFMLAESALFDIAIDLGSRRAPIRDCDQHAEQDPINRSTLVRIVCPF